MQNEQQIFDQINTEISVTRPQVIAAKEFILKEAKEDKVVSTGDCLQRFLGSIDSIPPKEVVIHPSVDTSQMIRLATLSISWQLAFSEAVWSLVHSSLLLPLSPSVYVEEPHISWTTVVPGSGGQSGGWRFPDWKYSLPERLRVAPSVQKDSEEFLVDPDLYLENLGIDSLHSDVSEALKDAIRCFRVELFTPCLAMLAKATEGAWVELGLALTKTIPDSQHERVKKYSESVMSEYSSIAKKIKTVLELYEKQDLFGDLSKQTNVKLEDLRNAAIWADCVRESRNVVHYGAKPSMPNNFEKIATLLLGAPSHFKLVYRLIGAANDRQA